MRLLILFVLSQFVCVPFVGAQTVKDVRAAAKQGSTGIPALAQYLSSKDVEVRVEVVRQLINIGGKDTIQPLIVATRDSDPEVQIRATDALVNFYLPGYVKTGLGSSLRRVGSSIKGRFVDNNDQIIDPFVTVRPDVIAAVGALARGGSNMDSRANAARAVGVLRGQAALPDLYEALKSKDNDVMYESLIAIQKIRDPEAGPHIVYLLRDLDDRVQTAALETAGLLRAKSALPTLRAIINSPRNTRSERAALISIAYMPEEADRPLLTRYLTAKDEKMRAAAAEGLGRVGDHADETALDKYFQEENKMLPRLAAAFALVMEGRLFTTDASPLQYLIFNLNSGSYRNVAEAYLEEAARKKAVRTVLYGPLEKGTRDERINLAHVFAASGDVESVPYLDRMSRDNDKDVAQEGLRAMRSLKSRLGV